MDGSHGEGRVRMERDGAVATVVLDRPEKLNALDKAMWQGVGETFRALDGEAALRCIVMRGAGDRALGPGADIAEFGTVRSDSVQAAQYGGLMHGAMEAIAACRHPVVARIKGLCVGGALELALMCDLRIAGESARFGIPVSRLGLVMAYPEIEALVAAFGPSVALEILLEARVFDASEALAKGLVTRIVPDEEVDEAVAQSVERICAGAPLVNRWHKRFIRKVASGAELSAADHAEGFACFDTDDFQEGVRAFLAKETPRFKGK